MGVGIGNANPKLYTHGVTKIKFLENVIVGASRATTIFLDVILLAL
jgi:hypothetical protein